MGCCWPPRSSSRTCDSRLTWRAQPERDRATLVELPQPGARRAGHGVAVLLKIYADRIDELLAGPTCVRVASSRSHSANIMKRLTMPCGCQKSLPLRYDRYSCPFLDPRRAQSRLLMRRDEPSREASQPLSHLRSAASGNGCSCEAGVPIALCC